MPLCDDLLAPLPEPFRAALRSMYNQEPQLGDDGQAHPIDGQPILTSREQGMWLYHYCRQTQPKATLEIGLAFGYSTIFFLAAIHENGGGHHTAIDPFQHASWHGIGASHPQRLGMSEPFRWLNDKSESALVDLAKTGERFDVIFIDGNHRFDDVLVDFTLSAAVCPIGGVILFDDTWMPAIHKAVAFIRSNRSDFAEIPTSLGRMAVFRRIANDMRNWDHYVHFFNSYDIRSAMRPYLPRFLRRLGRTIALRFYKREDGPW